MMKKSVRPPRSGTTIIVQNRQRALRVDLKSLQGFANRVLPACLTFSVAGSNQIGNLSEVHVILVSDREISDLHFRFRKIHGPTDVITFHHGEIFVSVETAQRQAQLFGTSTLHEIRLYLTHGLLHLQGFDDEDPADAAEMSQMQEKLVKAAGS